MILVILELCFKNILYLGQHDTFRTTCANPFLYTSMLTYPVVLDILVYQGQIQDFSKGGHMYKDGGFHFAECISFFLNMK